MKTQINEAKRMQQLAGILNEIKINNPNNKSWNFNQFETRVNPTTNKPVTISDYLAGAIAGARIIDWNTIEEVPFNFSIKKYINDQI